MTNGLKLYSEGSMESHSDEVKNLKKSHFFKKAHEECLKKDKKKHAVMVCEHPKTWKYV